LTRAVIDTGVLVAGIISPAGAPASLVRSWRLGEFDLIVCPMLLAELRRVLAYPKVGRYLTEDQAGRLLLAIENGALALPDPDQIPQICRDPADDYLFALARSFADVLVSGDKDILEAADPGVRVLTPAGFAEILRNRWN
jgi:putative PIN family toxin of toxin-antitoxin system